MSRLNRKRPIDYILPFLIMICAGVIVVLGYQLFSSINQSENDKDIYMFLAAGNAKILPWGAGEWERAYNGTKLLQGDSIKTQKGGRMVIELFEDHYIRLDEKTEITVSEIKKSGDAYELNILVREGKIWINDDDESEIPVKFLVRTDHTLIKTVSTIYEVEQSEVDEVIRVIKGTIIADILIEEDGKKNKIESIQIGVGQEAVLDEDIIQEFADRKSPSIVEALSDKFRDKSFYKWNMSEDNNPTDFSIKSSVLEDDSMFEDDEDDSGEPGESDLAKPEITTPSTLNFETTEDSLNIRGTTSFETNKMMVDVVTDGEEDTYELNLYVSGGSDWSFAISEDAGTLNIGVNTYSFYSLDEDDLKSTKAKLTITLGGADDEEEDPDADDPDDEEDVDLDLPPLVAPTVDSYNGDDLNVDDTGEVKIVGSVDGAKEIAVDGYTLQAFQPGDTTWTYYAKESLGNLEDGENIYTVVATDADGATKSFEFTITYNKPEVVEDEEPLAEDPPAEDPVEDAPVEDDPATEEPAV